MLLSETKNPAVLSKVGRGVGVSELYTNNVTLVKMEQQNMSHQKLLKTPLNLTMSAHALPYLNYSKVISSPFPPPNTTVLFYNVIVIT